jgi:hypothetical protein
VVLFDCEYMQNRMLNPTIKLYVLFEMENELISFISKDFRVQGVSNQPDFN